MYALQIASHASREGALRTPYELSKAQEDYENIVKALDIIEKSMADRNMLNVSDRDVVISSTTKDGMEDRDMLDVVKLEGRSTTIAVSLEGLLKKAVTEKSIVDAEFGKIGSAASAAQARGKR